MTGPGKVGLTFLAAVVAAVIGWFAGGAVREASAPTYDTAVAVVDAPAGVPVATSSPTPSPSATSEPSPTEATPSPTPEETRGSVICEGAPPDENCDCDLRDGEWVWVCEIPVTSEPSPAASP